MTRIALYARVSTSDKDQNPETQLLPLREYVEAQKWQVYDEYIDQAPANDLGHRTAWRRLLDDAAKKKFSIVLVFKLDRAFRSVKHMHDTLAAWELVEVSFKSVREQFDTSTALGRLLLNLLASLAEFELEMIRERVKAGMDRARKQGRHIGRPKVLPPGEASNVVLEGFWRASERGICPGSRRQMNWISATPPCLGSSRSLLSTCWLRSIPSLVAQGG